MVRMDYVVSQQNYVNPASVIFAMITFITSAVGGTIILLSENAGIYTSLFVLPFCYGLISFMALIYLGGNILKSVVSVLIFGGYFIKMVLTPCLFALGGYESFLGSCVTNQGINKAIIYMCLETAVVLGLAAYLGKRAHKEQETKINFPQYNTKVFNFVVGLLFLFLITAYIAIPVISEIYIFLPFADFNEIAEIQWDNETIIARGSIKRYIYSLFCFIWPVFRIIMPSLMITHFYKKYGMQTKGLICSFLCLILPAILLGGDNIAPFFGIFVGIIVINKLYKKKARTYLIVIGFVALILLGVVFASKVTLMSEWKGATGISVIAQMFHNYFPGFDNYAVMFDMQQDNKSTTLFFDLYYAIPFRETLFGLKGEYIQEIFLNYTKTGGQIVPFMGQLTYYVGPFALMLIVLVVRFAYSMEYKSRLSDNFWMYFICMYVSVYTAMALSTYSVSIYISGIVNVVLPVYIIIKLIEKKRGQQIGEK